MSYRKNQGRYARMIAFWAVALLVGYGFFRGGGMIDLMGGWIGSSDQSIVKSFPLLGELRLSSLVTIGIYAAILLLLHRILNRPRLADQLIEIEGEMQKVTWPTWGEVAQGTMAVAVMVLILFAFLSVVDLMFTMLQFNLLGGGGSA